MSLSPTCTINGGATPADVATNTTINGALANAAGVAFFAIKAIGSDDVTGTAGLATLNGTLVVNQTNKTFSFTSPPNAGTAIIFQVTVGVSPQSTLGSGRDVNGNIVAAWTTTFKVNIPTGTGQRVVAQNEVTEQDPTFGWLAPINAAIRVAGTGGSGGGGTTTTSNFTQPAVGSTVVVPMADATNALVGKGAEIAGGGFYTVTHISGLSVTLLNGTSAVNASPTSVINSGAVVTFGGLGAPQAGGTLNGQALQLQDGTLNGAGIATCVNTASFLAKADSGTTDNAPLINAALAEAASTGLASVMVPADPSNPTGFYGIGSPIFLSYEGMRLFGQHTQSGGIDFVSVKAQGYFGPTLVVSKSVPDPPGGFFARSYKGGTVHTAVFQTGVTSALEPCTYVDFSDGLSYGNQLNGLANASFRILFNPLSYVPGAGGLVAMLCSRGGIDSQSILTAFALEIGMTPTSTISFTLPTNSSGSSKTCNTGSTTLAANTLVEVLCQIDGTNNLMSICIDGILRGKTSIPSGMTMIQSKYENLCQGVEAAVWRVFEASQVVGGPVEMSGVQITSTVVQPIPAATALGTTIYTPVGQDPQVVSGSLVTSSFATTTATAFAAAGRPVPGWLIVTGDNSATAWYRWHGTIGANYAPHVEVDHLALGNLLTISAINCNMHHLNISYPRGITLDEFSYDSHIHDVTITGTAEAGASWCVMLGAGTQFCTVGPAVQLTGGNWSAVTLNGNDFVGGWANMGSDGGLLCVFPPISSSGTAATVSTRSWYMYDDGGIVVSTAGIKAWGVRLCLDGGDTGVSESSSCPAYVLDNCEMPHNTNRPGIGNSAAGVLSVIEAMSPPRILCLPESQLAGENFSGSGSLPWVDPSNPALVKVGSQDEQTGDVVVATDANHTMGVNEMLFGHWEVTSGVSLTATRTLVSPYNVLDQFARVHNATTGGQSITIGAVTITNGSFADVRNNGSGWVAA